MKTNVIPFVLAAGLVVGCNRSIESASQDFNTLPPAVQKAVRAQAPNAEIAHVSQDTQNGVQVYEVEFREAGDNPKMVVSANGQVLNSDGTTKPAGAIEKALTPTGAVGTQFSALPEPVQKSIMSRAPQTEIADISRNEENGRVIYKIEFKDQGQNPTMQIAEDGTIVQGLQK
ncbi:MAG: PepSY-like domain-containing protein [Verrucomicrobiota bacterium]